MAAELDRAATLMELRRYAEAEPVIRAHLATDPDSGRALCQLAETLVNLKRAPEAVEVARRATAAQPDQEHPYRLLAIALRGTGRNSEAVRMAQEAVSKAPWMWQTHYTLGSALRSLPTRHEDALNEALAAARIAPHEPAVHNLAGLCFSDLGRSEQAALAYQEALRIDPSYAISMNNLAAMQINKGRLSKASSFIGSGLAADPQEQILRQNYDALLLKLVRRLYFALIGAAVLLWILASEHAPYAVRVGTTVLLLGVYAGATWLVTRNLPRGTHLWARGLIKRVGGAQGVIVVAFIAFTFAVIAIGVAPADAVESFGLSGILILRVSVLACGAVVAGSRRRKRRANLPDLRSNNDRQRPI